MQDEEDFKWSGEQPAQTGTQVGEGGGSKSGARVGSKEEKYIQEVVGENLRVKQWWDQVLEEAERHSEVLDLVLRTKRSADDLGVQECRVR